MLRRFFASTRTSVLALTAAFCSFAASAQTARKIPDSWTLGTSTCLTSRLTPAIMKDVKESGIGFLEVGWNSDKMLDGSPAERKAYASTISAEAEKQGLVLWSTHLPYGKEYDISEPDEQKRQAIIERLKEYIDLSVGMKLKYMVIHPSEAIEESERPLRLAATRKSLRQISDYIRGKEIGLTIECLPPNFLANSSTEMLAILNGLDEVGICYDSNHLYPEQAEDFIRAVGSKIRTVHISDYDGRVQRHWMPERGVLDWNKVISGLIDAGYSGPFIYEVVRRENETHTFRDLKANYDLLKANWSKNAQ